MTIHAHAMYVYVYAEERNGRFMWRVRVNTKNYVVGTVSLVYEKLLCPSLHTLASKQSPKPLILRVARHTP